MAKYLAHSQPCTAAMQVRAQLAMLDKQWPVAENLLLSQGKVNECIAMYQEVHK
jgi:hypothetical protein